MMRSLGIDTSKWDLRPLDWRKAKSLLSFAFIKQSQGVAEDELFRDQWEAARGHVLRGIYHYFDPRVDPKTSVDKVLSISSKVSRAELPPALDLEDTFGRLDTLARARSWLEHYERSTGIRPIIYSAPSFLRDTLKVGEKSSVGGYINDWLRKYEVWMASYYYDKLPTIDRERWLAAILAGTIVPAWPRPIPPWITPPIFHQFSAVIRPDQVPGYYMGYGGKKEIDLNFFHGTTEELFSIYGKPIELPGGDNPMPFKYSITPETSDGLKIRADHYVIDSPSNRLGSIAAGSVAYGDERWVATISGTNYRAGDTWLRVRLVNGSPFDGWAAEIHNGVRVGRINILTTDPDPDPEPPPVEGVTVSIAVSLDPASPGQTLTGSIKISSPGRGDQLTSISLPPV